MKPKPPTVFWGNERVTHEAIIAQARAETRDRLIGQEQVLLVQDTVSFNFSHHPATEGLGSLENEYTRGFLAHNVLAVSTVGVPLGLLDQAVWARDPGQTGVRHQRHERAFAEKESYKWVQGLPETGVLPATIKPVIVCDAEAHIYEFLDVLHAQSLDYIVRAADCRGFTAEGQALFEAVAAQPVADTYTLMLKRRPDRAAREARLELRFGSITLRRPQRAQAEAAGLTMYVVDIHEIDPPTGERPIHWVLLTCLPVETVAQAQQIVTWYSYRWLVERLHYVFKSGCKIEDRQLREVQRLERLMAVYSLVAWRLLWLTYQARITPDDLCTVALTDAEWQALYLFIKRTKRLPTKPPTLREAVRWIGQLGGFLGRKGDGEPGVKVLWRGWSRLQDITETFTLLNSSLDVGNA